MQPEKPWVAKRTRSKTNNTKTMTNRTSFTTDEWQHLQLAPFWTVFAVAASDGNIDQKELRAMLEQIAQASVVGSPLVKEVLSSVVNNTDGLASRAKGRGVDLFTGLKRVADILEAKATLQEAEDFKRALLLMGLNVARASGGFLGFGDKVSKEEKLALIVIAKTLRCEFLLNSGF